MTYKYAVMRGPNVLDRTLTRSRAEKIAARYIGAVVVAALFMQGCATHGYHADNTIPCDPNNCGKEPK